MKRLPALVLIVVALLLERRKSYAQLEYIPSVEAQITDSPQLGGVFILNTMDFRPAVSLPALFPSSLQVIDPQYPWPPLFFANAQPGGTGFVGNGMYMDVRFSENLNQLSFFFGTQSDSGATSGKYYFADTSSFVVLDSFVDAAYRIDAHDLQLNNAGEKLYMKNFDTIVDISALSGNSADTSFLLTTQRIEIIDSNDVVVFSWNPLDFLPLSATYEGFSRQGFVLDFYSGFDWSHGNSARFAQDGNILYSYRNVGMGKVDRHNGNLLWQFAGKKPDMVPPGNAYPYNQHDFKEIAPGIYTVFANGNDTTPCKAIVYLINEANSSVKVLNNYQPSPPIISRGLGNFDMLENGLCLVNYGIYASFVRQKVFGIHDTTTGNLLAEYSLPGLTFSYQVHHVPAWKPARPSIVNESNMLHVDGAGSGVSWYQLLDTALIHLSDSSAYAPADSGVFLATVETGFGYLVSETIQFTKDSLIDAIIAPEIKAQTNLFYVADGRIKSEKYRDIYSVFTSDGHMAWTGRGDCDISNFSSQLFFVKTPSGYLQKLVLTY